LLLRVHTGSMPRRWRSHAAAAHGLFPVAVSGLAFVTLRIRLLALHWSLRLPPGRLRRRVLRRVRCRVLCRVGQQLAAVRLRLDNLFIKQSDPDRPQRCVRWMKGTLTRGDVKLVSAARSGGLGFLLGRVWRARHRSLSVTNVPEAPPSRPRIERGGIFGEFFGLWETLVHYGTHNAPRSHNPPR
jgi:hypothetical protein